MSAQASKPLFFLLPKMIELGPNYPSCPFPTTPFTMRVRHVASLPLPSQSQWHPDRRLLHSYNDIIACNSQAGAFLSVS